MTMIQPKPLSARELHKIVWILVGVFAAIAATFPTAMIRVSQMEKFRGFHVKSLPVDLVAASDKMPKVVPTTASDLKLIPPLASTPELPTAASLDQATLTTATQRLFEQIDAAWKSVPTFNQNLVYRVQVNAAGMLIAYEPLNQLARDYLSETPLSSLLTSSDIENRQNSAMPVGILTIVFTPSGVLEVNP